MDYNSKYSGAEVEAILDRAGDCITKGESVDFATDLTGVVEATHEEFTYRPSAGRKSIRDKSAVIRRIKGNSLVWNQLIRERAFIGANVILSYNEDGSINTINNGSGSCGIMQSLVNTIPSRHKVLVVVDYKRSSLTQSNCLFYLRRKNVGDFDKNRVEGIQSTERRVDSVLITTTDECNLIYVYPFLQGEEGSSATIYSVMAIDLTQMFGAGNEPITVDEFYARMPDGVNLTAYNAGELISMNANAIETTGFNQWDEEWEVGGIGANTGENADVTNRIRSKNFIPIIGGETYNFHCASNGETLSFSVACYDENKKFIGSVKNGIYPSTSATSANYHNPWTFEKDVAYIRFATAPLYGTTYKKDICINLSHSGVRDGEYKPYEKNTLLLPEIAKYFPNGMHGIGDVCDEIIDGLAIQRIGEVDLGNSDIKYDSTRTAFYLRLYNSKTLGKGICLKFTLNNVSAPNLSDGEMSFHNTYYDHSVIFKATSYTDVTSFKSAMSSVKLYYELVEPIYTPINEPLQLAYAVDDFGTEKMLSDAPSSPFKADIVYQFNAEGRIRDNSRNIDSLEGQIQTLYQGEDTTGSIANTIKRNTISFDKLTDVSNADGLIKGRDTKAYIDAAIKNATPFVVDADKNVTFPEKVVARSFEDSNGNAVMLAKDIPTEVATATQRVAFSDMSGNVLISPNIMYEFNKGIGSSGRFVLPGLFILSNAYDHVWMLRFPSIVTSSALSYPYTIMWKDGVAPTFSETCALEIYLKMTDTEEILGEWRIYKYN